ncbi:DUF4232 domain-containing protein [Streptomyces acidiscabies]|uniref:DUF4232 domain-containing protein n=1 Tax=Streptomyces acidiscabies TaxID=42234 RepID=UPI0030D1FDDC
MTLNRKLVTAAATTLLTVATIGAAQAAPRAAAAPSACRPANHLATIAQDQSSAGHIHFRVTLTAPRGYASCTLAGSPTGVRFSDHGTPLAITAGRYGDQTTAVTFGPGHPVHFDIQVPNMGNTVPADEASFTLRTPGGGTIPGTSFADGTFRVATGTLIGPMLSADQ